MKGKHQSRNCVFWTEEWCNTYWGIYVVRLSLFNNINKTIRIWNLNALSIKSYIKQNK